MFFLTSIAPGCNSAQPRCTSCLQFPHTAARGLVAIFYIPHFVPKAVPLGHVYLMKNIRNVFLWSTSSTYIYIYSSIHLIYYINSYYIITTIILIQRSSPVPHVSPPARFVPATSPAPGRPGASASRRRCWATPRASPATWVTPTACGRPGGARRPAAELARSRQKMVEQCGKMWKVSMKSWKLDEEIGWRLGGYHSLSTKRGITLSEIDIKVEPMRKTFKKKTWLERPWIWMKLVAPLFHAWWYVISFLRPASAPGACMDCFRFSHKLLAKRRGGSLHAPLIRGDSMGGVARIFFQWPTLWLWNDHFWILLKNTATRHQ